MTEKQTITSYKIRNSAGLYSSGGSYPSFRKTGKTWGTLGHLKSHLTLVGHRSLVYKDCVVVTHVHHITVDDEETFPLSDLLDQMETNVEAQERLRQARRKTELQDTIQRAQHELKRLQ